MKKFRIVEKIDTHNRSDFFPEVSFNDGNDWISLLPEAEQRINVGDNNINIAKGRISLYKTTCEYLESNNFLHLRSNIIEEKIYTIN